MEKLSSTFLSLVLASVLLSFFFGKEDIHSPLPSCCPPLPGWILLLNSSDKGELYFVVPNVPKDYSSPCLGIRLKSRENHQSKTVGKTVFTKKCLLKKFPRRILWCFFGWIFLWKSISINSFLWNRKKTIKRSIMFCNSYYNDHNTFSFLYYPDFDFFFFLSNYFSQKGANLFAWTIFFLCLGDFRMQKMTSPSFFTIKEGFFQLCCNIKAFLLTLQGLYNQTLYPSRNWICLVFWTYQAFIFKDFSSIRSLTPQWITSSLLAKSRDPQMNENSISVPEDYHVTGP